MIHDANFQGGRGPLPHHRLLGADPATSPGMMESQLEQYEAEGLIMKADTIEELADKMGFCRRGQGYLYRHRRARYNEL